MKNFKRLNPLGFASGLLMMFSLFSCGTTHESDVVRTLGRKLLVNDKPYLIKGVCYHPVSKGQTKRSFEFLDQDLALMVEAGINTIRVYEPIEELEVLDKIAASGLKVIIGFGYNQNGYYDLLSGSYLDYIKKYKNHNAILFWELGNEYNYHPEWFDGNIAHWYAVMNRAAEVIHQEDENHPVSTAHGELPDALAINSCPEIDLWGLNVYRWDQPETIFPQWESLSNKPLYLSEAGADSYMAIEKAGFVSGENQKAQHQAIEKITRAVMQNQALCSGVTLFSFVDEWWKAGNPNQQDIGGWAPNSNGVPYDGAPNEEFWGIITIERKKKTAFEAVKQIFNHEANSAKLVRKNNVL